MPTLRCSPQWCDASENKSERGPHRNHTPGRDRYRALHPLRGAAPLTWRYTRSERVHCLQIGCIAYGSGAAPTLTSTNVDHSTTRVNFNTTTAGPTQRNDRSTSTHGRQYPKPRHVSDLPDRGLNSFRISSHRIRAQTRKHTPNPSPQPSVVARRKPQKIDSPRPP